MKKLLIYSMLFLGMCGSIQAASPEQEKAAAVIQRVYREYKVIQAKRLLNYQNKVHGEFADNLRQCKDFSIIDANGEYSHGDLKKLLNDFLHGFSQKTDMRTVTEVKVALNKAFDNFFKSAADDDAEDDLDSVRTPEAEGSDSAEFDLDHNISEPESQSDSYGSDSSEASEHDQKVFTRVNVSTR
jgi:hypothetical protein